MSAKLDAALAGGADEGVDRQCGLLGFERNEHFGDLGVSRWGWPRSAQKGAKGRGERPSRP